MNKQQLKSLKTGNQKYLEIEVTRNTDTEDIEKIRKSKLNEFTITHMVKTQSY